jgi:hypothetical protein
LSAELPDQEHVEMLRRSAQTVGFLSDIIFDENKPDDILSGKHRIVAVPEWTRKPAKVCSPLHRELIIVHANVQRQVPEEVTRLRLLRIARLLSTTGGMVNGKMIDPVAKEDVCTRMTDPKDPLVPFSDHWVRKCLPDEFKHVEFKNKPQKEADLGPPTILSDKNLTERQKALLQPFTKKEKDVGKLVEAGLQTGTLGTTYPFVDCHCQPIEIKCPDCGKTFTVECPKRAECYS